MAKNVTADTIHKKAIDRRISAHIFALPLRFFALLYLSNFNNYNNKSKSKYPSYNTEMKMFVNLAGSILSLHSFRLYRLFCRFLKSLG